MTDPGHTVGAGPLDGLALVALGDDGAGLCVDGVCAVPAPAQALPAGQAREPGPTAVGAG